MRSDRQRLLPAEPSSSRASLPYKVYPSTDLLPSNMLRLHLRFSVPQDIFDITTDVRLIDSDGQQVAHPFLDLPDGLWSTDGRTLTLLLHPGRIKSGLKAQSALGFAMREHKQYVLQLRSAGTVSSVATDSIIDLNTWITVKKFAVIEAVVEAIALESVAITTLQDKKNSLVTVKFDRPIDRLALENFVVLVDSHMQQTMVTWAIDEHEKTIAAITVAPLPSGKYAILLAAELEDIAGNRISAAFEGAGLSNREDIDIRLPFDVVAS
jgi:hypothetical protein